MILFGHVYVDMGREARMGHATNARCVRCVGWLKKFVDNARASAVCHDL